MRRLWFGLLALTLAATVSAQVHVRGYWKKDGTYVAPYVRSSPNSTKTDNYSARGNYNPYIGRTGTVDPYRPTTPRPLVYSSPLVPSYNPAPSYSGPPVNTTRRASVWRCTAATGARIYLAYPRAGCDEIQVTIPSTPPVASVSSLQFSGYPCTMDCSGHEAGYQWAEENGIGDPNDCGGTSQSFIEGCESFAEQRALQTEEVAEEAGQGDE